jgi:hypothetical protein
VYSAKAPFPTPTTRAPCCKPVTASPTVDGVVTGAVIALLIISPLGRSSGGHFNPAVTVTMWLLRSIPGGDVGAYVGAQLAGSVVGVLAGRAGPGPRCSRRRQSTTPRCSPPADGQEERCSRARPYRWPS